LKRSSDRNESKAGRSKKDAFESGFITLVQPANRLVPIIESDTDQSEFVVDRGIPFRRSESPGAETHLREIFLKQSYHDAIA
jgi:hypothetical protein